MAEMEEVVTAAFQQSQFSIHAHPKLIKSIEAVKNEENFTELFMNHLKRAMLYHKKEPAVEKIIDFVIKFALSKRPPTSKPNNSFNEDEDGSESMDPFLLSLFNFLLDHHGANDKAVRYRACQIVNKLLKLMGDEDTIDEDLADRMFACMLIRITDKIPTIRIQATLALARLQDPTDKSCAVIEAYLRLISTDGNADVRKAILRSIALTKSTLPSIIERTRDTKDSVRSTAYLVIANQVHIKALTIAQRLQILNSGLQDRSETVRRTCTKILLKNWLTQADNSVLNLLQCLDVENSLDVNEVVMETILKDCQIDEQIEALSSVAEKGTDVLIEFQSLTPEVVFFWRCLVKHVAQMGTEQMQLKDKVLPGVSAYCDYISRYTSIQEESAAANIDFASGEFITIELIKIAKYLDYSDEVGRKRMNSMLQVRLISPSTSQAVVPHLVSRLDEIMSSKEDLTRSLAEIIADIREPIVADDVTPQMLEVDRVTKLKLAKLTVQLNELRDNLKESITNEEFEEAANFKEEIKRLEAEKKEIEEENNKTDGDQQQRVVKDDAETVLKCLNVASAMLECLTGKTLSPTVSTLVETLILPGVQHENPILRNIAIKCLGLCSLMNKDFACHHLILFLQVAQMDQDIVKVTSLQVIFDLLQMFGVETFPSSTLQPQQTSDETAMTEQLQEACDDDATVTSNPEQTEQSQTDNDSVSGVLEILLLLLDSENWDVRTTVAEGMAKLLLSGRISSPRLLSRLFLLWYNPTSEDDIHLRHCLGVFFPVFAYMSRSNQKLIQEAFLPTFRTICNAPSSSPLSTINTNNVADLFVKLTRPDMVDQRDQSTVDDNTVTGIHESSAMLIANELLSESFDAVEHVRVLCRMLASLELKDLSTVKDLSVMSTNLLQLVRDKLSVNQLIKFQRNLTFWLQDLTAATTSTIQTSSCPSPIVEVCEQLEDMAREDSSNQSPTEEEAIQMEARKRPRAIETTPASVKASEKKRLSFSPSPESLSQENDETRRTLDPELDDVS